MAGNIPNNAKSRDSCCGGQGAGEGGGQTIVSIRIRSGNKRKGGQGIGAGGGQTIVSIRIMSGNKRKPGSADLTRFEKSDLSRDFFSCLDCDSARKDFLDFFDFR